jgi:sulfatase modifying factor 1
VCKGASCGNHPRVCVDWCDAYAYCKAVGKRLCGKVAGGSSLFEDYADAAKSQWFNACSANNANAYPYGGAYNGQACNGHERSVGTSVPAGSLPDCQSSLAGYTHVYDLSGNVSEWEDSCDATVGNLDSCRIRGGAFTDGDYHTSSSSYLSCGHGLSDLRSAAQYVIGFRCCSDP